jgi:hypothetical protein
MKPLDKHLVQLAEATLLQADRFTELMDDEPPLRGLRLIDGQWYCEFGDGEVVCVQAVLDFANMLKREVVLND